MYRKRFVVSTEDVNEDGFWIKTAGIQLDDARKNCPAFYNHQTWDLPIGHWENFTLINSTLEADIVIDDEGGREQDIVRKIENGALKGASIGADIIATGRSEQKSGQTRVMINSCRLYEISLTPLPANKSALAKDGIKLSKENINKLLPPITMEAINKALGLDAGANEQDALKEIAALQQQNGQVQMLHAAMDYVTRDAEQILDQEEMALYKKIAEKSVPEALAYLQLSKSKTKDTTGFKLSEFLKEKGSPTVGEDFISLSRNNPEKLAQIKAQTPETYQKLVQDYISNKKSNVL